MPVAFLLAVLSVTVSSQAEVPRTVVALAIAEAETIWKPAHLPLVWNHPAQPSDASLLVAIGTATGGTRDGEAEQPVGWIPFEAGRPQPEIYLSYANAMSLLENSRGVVGNFHGMPAMERDMCLGRALGRALAHELGHYLFASKAHTARGLMKAHRTAYELFGPYRGTFAITSDEGTLARARLEGDLVAGMRSGSSPAPSPATSWPAPADAPSRRPARP